MAGLYHLSKRILVVIFSFALLFILNSCSKSPEIEFSGSFYANDCGVSDGGFEWAGEYTASLAVRGSKGDLTLSFKTGLGDPLTRHQFSISDFAEAGGYMSFKIDGKAFFLEFVENETIWNGEYNNHFIGNRTDNPSEKIGWLAIEPFSGFKSHYYIELRLKPKETMSRFSLID